MRILVAFLFLGAGAIAQPISFGIRGGVPLTDAFTSSTFSPIASGFSSSNDYVIGAMAELHLPLGFSVEGDALYRPLDLTTVTATPGGLATTSTTFNSWEFPILGKFHFLPLPIVKPYVEAGPSFRDVSTGYFSSAGFVFGLGVEIKIARLRIEPDLRYERWGGDAASILTHPPTQLNQVELLVGLTF